MKTPSRDIPFGELLQHEEFPSVSIFVGNDQPWPGNRRAMLALKGEVKRCRELLDDHGVSPKEVDQMLQPLEAWTEEGEKAKQYSREVYKKRRAHILHEIETQLGLPAISPEGAFYTMIDVRSICEDEMEICEKFLQNRVITIAGKAFGSETAGFLRLSFCCDETKITEGVRRMKEALG